MLKVAVVLAVLACVYGAEYADDAIPKQAPGPDANKVYHHLAHEQLYVNKDAYYKGSGIGTAGYEGVPGTDLDRHHRHPYNHVGLYGYGYHGDGYHGDGYHGDGYHGDAYNKHHKGAFYNYGPYNDHFYGHPHYEHPHNEHPHY